MFPDIDHIDRFLDQQLHFHAEFAQSAPAQVSVARSLHLIGGWIAGSVHLFQSEVSGYCLERGWVLEA